MNTGTRIQYARRPLPSTVYTGTVSEVTPDAWLIAPEHAPNKVHAIELENGKPARDIEWRILPETP